MYTKAIGLNKMQCCMISVLQLAVPLLFYDVILVYIPRSALYL